MHRIESPATGDSAIEQEIKAKGLTAPRVTPADIAKEIVSEHYFTAMDGVAGAGHTNEHDCNDETLELLTFCVLVLQNGFTITGESACASPENFDAEIGRKIARENAVNKIWPLLGFRLRDTLQWRKEQADMLAPVIEPQPPCDNAHVAAGCEQLPE